MRARAIYSFDSLLIEHAYHRQSSSLKTINTTEYSLQASLMLVTGSRIRFCAAVLLFFFWACQYFAIIQLIKIFLCNQIIRCKSVFFPHLPSAI